MQRAEARGARRTRRRANAAASERSRRCGHAAGRSSSTGVEAGRGQRIGQVQHLRGAARPAVHQRTVGPAGAMSLRR